MTDELDELLELKPTHASVLLVDPVELADRASRSARGARRRANGVIAGMSAAGVTIAVAIGSMFIQPMFAMPAASTSPTAASTVEPMYGGDDPADYSTPRVAVGELTGTDRPDSLCVYSRRTIPVTCVPTVPITGLAWSQVGWQTTSSGTTTAEVVVWGRFDGKTFHVTAVTRGQDTVVGYRQPVPSPAPPTTALIACDKVVVTKSPSASSTPSGGDSLSLKDGLTFPGLVAYWMDFDNGRLMVATSGSLEVAEQEVPKYLDGTACIGKVPQSGPMADLLEAATRIREAKIDGVTSVALSQFTGGVLDVTVVANVPGLRERVVAAAGPSVSLEIVPLLITVT